MKTKQESISMKTNSWFFHIKETVKFPIHCKIQQSSNLLAMPSNSEVNNSISDTQSENPNTSHTNTHHFTNPPTFS